MTNKKKKTSVQQQNNNKDNIKNKKTTQKVPHNNVKKKKNKENALDHKCPGCRAPIFFIPSLGKWKCDYCDSSFSLNELQKFKNASSLEENNDIKLTEESMDLYSSYKCQNCGAEIIADNQTSATFCVYCGNTAILKSKLSGQFKPDFIIPFKKDKKNAIEAFQKLAKGRPFLPRDFNNIENIEKIRGIYIPFWMYDMTIEGSVEGRGQTIDRWRSGDIQFTKVNFYKIFLDGSSFFNRIPIDGSSRFDNDIMGSIEPFDYKELVPYNHAYLSGFFAERYDIEGDILVGNAVSRAVESTKNLFLKSMSGYNKKSIFNHSLRANNVKKQYALLPVWMVNVKYKDKYYLFAMNGQTGKFIGNMPVDKSKVLIHTIVMFLITFIIIILIGYIIFWVRWYA